MPTIIMLWQTVIHGQQGFASNSSAAKEFTESSAHDSKEKLIPLNSGTQAQNGESDSEAATDKHVR